MVTIMQLIYKIGLILMLTFSAGAFAHGNESLKAVLRQIYDVNGAPSHDVDYSATTANEGHLKGMRPVISTLISRLHQSSRQHIVGNYLP